MESRNEYLYGRGTNTELIDIPKNLYLNFTDAKNKLTKSKSEILIPKFIGVYQTKSAMVKKRDIEEMAFFSINELLRSGLETKMAIETAKAMGKDATTLQPSMISVLYDPRQETRESVNHLFDDQLQRISIYPVNEAPNFRNKDGSLRELILGNIKEIVSNESSYDEQIRLLKMNLELIGQDHRKYGLTLEEWVFFNNSKIIWGDGADTKYQKKMIRRLRSLSKHLTEEEE